jgi:hypothetical protein
MTFEEELQELRAYKLKHESCACDRAFVRLQELLDNVNYDPICSPRAFRVLAECLLALKDEVRR